MRVRKMKIIDFEKKGNLVRLYLGKDDCFDYWGDDWNDAPYEHNAGTVYKDYIVAVKDVCFPFDDLVLEPCDEYGKYYSKEDMKKRRIPFMIVVPNHVLETAPWKETFSYWVGHAEVKKYYFEDKIDEVL